MVATPVFDDCQVTDFVKSWKLPSVKIPVATNSLVSMPLDRTIVQETGATIIDSSCAGVMVSFVIPEIAPDDAVIVVVPTPTDVARPFEPVVLLIVDARVFEELHVTDSVISCIAPPVNVPMAVNCWFLPRTMLGLTGVTVIPVSIAGVTVSVAKVERTPENVEMIVVVPSETAVANPIEPGVLPMVAIPVFDDNHVAHVVNDCVVVSASVPVAVNCWVVPLAMLALVGNTSMDDTVDDLNAADPDTPPYDAATVAVPAETAVANPFEPAVLPMETMPVSIEVQVAHVVRLCSAALSRVPLAENCWVVPGAILGGFNGVTEIKATEDVVRVTRPFMLPEAAVIVVVPAETAVASPFVPAVLLTEAIPSSNEVQVTEDVRFCLPPFEKVPCAVNCKVVPGAMLGESGLMAMDTSEGGGGGLG